MLTHRRVSVALALALGSLGCSGSSSDEGPASMPDGGPDSSVASGDAGNPGTTDEGGDATEGAESSTAGTPLLTALSVTAPTSSSLALVPAFSPNTHDYYVRCAAGTNVLTISMTASSGAESALSQPVTSPAAATQTQTLSVTENQAIVAVATQGAASSDYWIRCLPHDFPMLAMATHPDAGAAPGGYYLVGNLMPTSSGGYAMVLDSNGVPVWYYEVPAGLGTADVDAVVSGALSFFPYSATTLGSFEYHQLSPPSKTTVSPTGYATDVHELRVLPNGDYLVLSYPLRAGVDLTGLSIASPDGGALPLGPDSTIQDCAIVEFEPSGNVVSTWLASDHFDPVQDSTLPLTGFGPGATSADGGTVYDVFHCNSIDVDPTNGNLLVSAREMDSIFYVDRPSGRVLWKMGGPQASKDGAVYVSVPDPFFRQHDARLQPGWSATCNGGSGQITLFDDESQAPGPARGVLYNVVVGGGDAGTAGCDGGSPVDGGVAGQAIVAWQYKGQISSAATGSFRISPDGSHVIGWGLGGTPNLAFTEVDENGNDLLDFGFPDGNVTYRAIKVPLSTFDLGQLRSSAGSP